MPKPTEQEIDTIVQISERAPLVAGQYYETGDEEGLGKFYDELGDHLNELTPNELAAVIVGLVDFGGRLAVALKKANDAPEQSQKHWSQ